MDEAARAGLAFTHHAARSERWHLPETMGSGGALFDLDGDGDLDALLLDSGAPPGSPLDVRPRHALFRNVSTRAAGLRFEPLAPPELPGLAAMGACTGDVDRDGDADVFVTGLPRGRLLRNDGGALVPVPGDAGIADEGWGTSCVLFDPDADGDLDLYVAHYVAWSATGEPACGGEVPGFRSYCPPDKYRAERDRLFVNDGTGRFTDGSDAWGLPADDGKGLGVVAAQLDDGPGVDLYVANDQTPSLLLLNRTIDGRRRFVEAGLVSGTALSEEGKAQAGMGVDAGDVDGDGDLDLTKTNFDLEPSNLLLRSGTRADGMPRYRDAARESGIAQATLPLLGFGTLLADLDLDGDLDLASTNGHILPNIDRVRPDQSHAMVDQLLESDGRTASGAPRYVDARARWMPAAGVTGVGRAMLAGDLDQDGDLDLVVTRNDGPVRLLRNRTDPAAFLGYELVATRSAPGAPGARVELRHAGPWCTSVVAVRRTGGSYLGTGDERVVLAVPGDAPACVLPLELVVHWPTGARERFPGHPKPASSYARLVEGSGEGVP